MNFSLENLPSKATASEVRMQFYACDLKAFLVTEQNECEWQRHAWAVVKQTVGYEIAAEFCGVQASKNWRMAVFDVPVKFGQNVEAMRSNCNSEIFIRIAKDPLPDLDDSEFEIQWAMATANERRGSWRENARMVVEPAEDAGSRTGAWTGRRARAGVVAMKEEDAEDKKVRSGGMGVKRRRRTLLWACPWLEWATLQEQVPAFSGLSKRTGEWGSYSIMFPDQRRYFCS